LAKKAGAQRSAESLGMLCWGIGRSALHANARLDASGIAKGIVWNPSHIHINQNMKSMNARRYKHEL